MLRSIYKGTSHPLRQPATNEGATSMREELEACEEESGETQDALAPLASTSSSSSSDGNMGPPRLPGPKGKQSRTKSASAGVYSPLPAGDCFAEALEVELEGHGVWRVYFTPPGRSQASSAPRPPKQRQHRPQGATATTPTATASSSPNHSQGIASITDPQLAALQLPDVESDDEDDASESASTSQSPGTMFVFHHGAGFSGLSFAMTAREIARTTKGEVGALSIDCRGHGRTRHPAHVTLPLDMSIERLTADYVAILRKMYPSASSLPTLILVGHSMGGSVVVSLSSALQSLGPEYPVKVGGVVVMDVVEGTAMEALAGMETIIRNHPKGFHSVQDAVRWHVESGAIQNVESARRSVPSLVIENTAYDGKAVSANDDENDDDGPQGLGVDETVEELAELADSLPSSSSPSLSTTDSSSSSLSAAFPYVWRSDLSATQPYWPGWFAGLSNRFLAVRTVRLLLLAGTDRLDKELMVGQMQGKYQLTVFQDVGHCIQEDAPDRTAKLLVDFWRRNDVVPSKLLGMGIKKVGDA